MTILKLTRVEGSKGVDRSMAWVNFDRVRFWESGTYGSWIVGEGIRMHVTEKPDEIHQSLRDLVRRDLRARK